VLPENCFTELTFLVNTALKLIVKNHSYRKKLFKDNRERERERERERDRQTDRDRDRQRESLSAYVS